MRKAMIKVALRETPKAQCTNTPSPRSKPFLIKLHTESKCRLISSFGESFTFKCRYSKLVGKCGLSSSPATTMFLTPI